MAVRKSFRGKGRRRSFSRGRKRGRKTKSLRGYSTARGGIRL